MVIAVMVVSAICILVLLASYLSVSGKATGTVPSKESITSILESSKMVSGQETIRSCNNICLDQKRFCVLSRSKMGKLLTCDREGISLICLCAELN